MLFREHHDVQSSVLNAFYVDNYLQSLSSIPEAKAMVTKLCSSLFNGGFEVRQWASNHAWYGMIDHLPTEARSVHSKL